ncbi:peptide/nickel transport system substrate-binding protein [Frondihabitans sp. PhB188]|uniref:ABC transporter substrate-binding protein n=1 Tax=Frondihabitans sp. PhB188 TaxID=2485200 RepID=UPI000FB3D48B|nr:ABC transporter substrate-binding protein [Frondihabitans sp. PhB188]ROQ38665.1 peptide/nickel transport system substrate-binding protein [Frondihabitans sp. PhB188]
MFRWKTLTAIAVVAGLALTGCSSNSGSTDSSNSGSGTLTLGVLAPATSFAAQSMSWANESPYGQAVYDGLVHADPDGTVVPWLATKWSYDSSKTKLTMDLRTDVKFSDGTKFDASAAAQNVLRFRDGDSANKSLLALVKDAKAVDSSTLEIDLTAPDPALLTSLTQNAGQIESPAAFTSSTLKTVPVGSGPYTMDVKNTVVGSSYAFTKNPDYWAPQDQHYAKLVLKYFATPTALLNAIRGGQVNGANVSDITTVDQIKAAGWTLNDQEYNWAGLILFDRGGTVDKPLGNVKVRQAINYAFDTKALLKTVGYGYGTTTTQIFPTSSPGYDKSLDSAYAYNPTKAKELMKEAGYADGFTLSQPSSALLGTATYTLLAQQLKAIGITVKFTDPGNNFIADVLAPKYTSSYFQLQQDPTAWQILNFELLPTATFNPYKYNDPKVVAWGKTIQSGSESEAAAATKELNAYIVQQAWFAPWFRPKGEYVTDAKTSAIVQVGNAYPYLYNIKPKS